MKDEVKITVIATGFDKKPEPSAIAASLALLPRSTEGPSADAGPGDSDFSKAPAVIAVA